MKRVIYALIVPLVAVGGLVFANRETSKVPLAKPLSAAERDSVRKQWEATPDGIAFNKWKASPRGRKVFAAEVGIWKHINASTSMEAVVTDLSLPPGSRLGFGVMVRINAEDYILSFGVESDDNNLGRLHSLKVNDKIIIRTHAVSHAPKYSYPIITGDYVQRDGRIIYKRAPRKDGC